MGATASSGSGAAKVFCLFVPVAGQEVRGEIGGGSSTYSAE
jgi:hypothetical protein